VEYFSSRYDRGKIFNVVIPFIVFPLVLLWILLANEQKTEKINQAVYSTNTVDYIVEDGVTTVWDIAQLAQTKGYIESQDINKIKYYIEMRNNFAKYGIRRGDIIKIPIIKKIKGEKCEHI
jgi:hypothetical protein